MTGAQALAWLLGGGWRYAAGAAAVLAVAVAFGATWGHGYRAATAKCEAAALRAERDALKRDLDTALAAARDASARAETLQRHAQRNEEVMRDYETRLAKAPQPACALTDDDLRSLRGIGAR